MAENRIDLNTASREELMRLQGIGPERADDIVRYREEHGGFKSIDDLDRIPGFAGTLTDDVKRQLHVGGGGQAGSWGGEGRRS